MGRTLLILSLLIIMLFSCKLKEEESPTEPGETEDEIIRVINPNGGDSIMVASSYNITWESTVNSPVVIQYTPNNGGEWFTIADSVSNTGVYTWYPVPNTRSSYSRVRIFTLNQEHYDVSDTTFSIIENSNKIIVLTMPEGGEVIPQDGFILITWVSSKVSNVDIEYSADNGETWNTVASNYDAEIGAYLWEDLPPVNSSNCLIRVLDSGNNEVYGMLESTFTLVMTDEIVVLYPNGGEEIEGGTELELKWYSKNIPNVNIEYTINNGLDWSRIVSNLPNTGVYYWNPVPKTPSALTKIRVIDADDPSSSDESDAAFSITPEAQIVVTSPTPGERWVTGSTQYINWTSKNIADVKIEYTTNNGSDWFTIAESVPSEGSYTWNSVPYHNSSLCNIRISDAADGQPKAMLEEPFTIYTGEDILEVYTPNGGESWEIGTEQEITWFAEGVNSLKIEFTTNNGQSWDVIESSVKNTGSYYWKGIPNTPTNLAKVRISDAADGSPSDMSDAVFTISQESQIQVVSPNGGEKLQAGTNVEIEWTSTNVSEVNIEYTINNGASWDIIAENVSSYGSYAWKEIPDTINSQQCRIRISDAIDGIPSDISDNNFTITNQVVKSLRLASPNGGEDWEAGTKQNITWNSTGVQAVKVELTTNQGGSWEELADEVTGGALEWNINSELNSTQCQIRISDITDNSVSDVSDGTFTISPVKSITVTAPVGGNIFKDSDPVTIRWESTGIKSVGIRYTTTNGVGSPTEPDYYDLVTKIANQGSFTTSFSIPSDQYFVVVYNADEGDNETPSARSNGRFTVVETFPPEISILEPTGGEQWLVSKANAAETDVQNYHPYEIKWNATNIEKVKIEWTTTGGGTWYTAPGADSTMNDGIFVWAPGRYEANYGDPRPDSSDNCFIRISDLSGDYSDRSDNFFSIHESKKIRIEFPSDETEYFTIDDEDRYPMDIRWTSYAVASVDIYYSLDNGVTWVELVSNYQSTGAYEWFYPYDPVNGPFSTLGRIKIVDHDNDKIWDVNDTPFWLNKREGQGN